MDDRALIFSNLLNGVSLQQVARDFRRSESECEVIFSFILRKIKSYCFERSLQKNAYPMVIASNVAEAKRYRLTCLTVLPNLNLDKDPRYKDIQAEIVTMDNLEQVGMNLNT